MTRSVFSPACQRLRALQVDARRERKVTQAELAASLGRPQSFVSKYERGERRRDLSEAIEVAAALGADVRLWVAAVRGSMADQWTDRPRAPPL